MATGELSYQIDCPICFDVFEDPVTLICGHSLCRNCLSKLMNHHGKDRVSCPECRTAEVLKHVTTINELGTNYRLRDAIDLIKNHHLENNSIKSKCPNCLNVDTMVFCEHCSMLLCNNCKKSHGYEFRDSLLRDVMSNIDQINEHIDDLHPVIVALKRFAKTKTEKQEVCDKIQYKSELKEAVSNLTELSNKLMDAKVLTNEEAQEIAADFQMMRINLDDEEENLSSDLGTHQGLLHESKGGKEGHEGTQTKTSTVMDVLEQKNKISKYLKMPLKVGEIWYLVDINWFKKWKKYVGFDGGRSSVGEESAKPGPIDNTPIFKENSSELQKQMLDKLDYILLPKDGWNLLVALYGLCQESHAVARKVIEQGTFIKQCKVEVDLMELQLCENCNKDNLVTREFSKGDKLQYLENEMRTIFNIPNSKNVQLYSKLYMSNTFEHLNEMDITLLDAGIYDGQTIMIEEVMIEEENDE